MAKDQQQNASPDAKSNSSRLLMIVVHPDLDTSRANLALLDVAKNKPLIDVVDLYDEYPNLFIDGAKERARLEQYDTIILQYPIYWYAAPGLLKEWIDRTLKYGWAYGEGGHALADKKILCSITTGSDNEAYSASGLHGLSIYELMKPMRQLALFCSMKWLEPFVTHEARRLDEHGLELQLTKFSTKLDQLIHPAQKLQVANSNQSLDEG